MSQRPKITRSDPEERSYKREILVVAVLAAALLLGGAVYTALRGTPPNLPNFTGPAVVHSRGPATMPGPAAMPIHRPGDAYPAPAAPKP